MSLQRPNILRMRGYSFGEQPSSKLVTKLNTNENPYPPSPQVAEALASIDTSILNRYPNPVANAFRETAACLHDLHVDNIIPTNGGDELLRLIVTTYVDPTETLATTAPAYSLYPVLAATQNCNFVEIPLTTSWNLPENLGSLLNKNKVKAFFLINPHAPTGQLFSSEQIERVASEFDGLLVIDEAYVDFVDPIQQHNCVPLIDRHENLIILRTMSKGYSLAGLRFGYGLACADLIAPLANKTRDSYNTDSIAQILATAALKSKAYSEGTWQKIRQSRQRLALGLQNLGISCSSSEANFLLCTVDHPIQINAQTLYEKLKKENIFVRYFEEPLLQNKIRITVGSDDENKRLLSLMRTLIDP
ncbi:MAG: histidinol-phosphate transaminase [Deltaproteobacteria bacterium]|jgi:histidinol-phosphate aminotransferase|nr:histidinol-phosphate transaminase [Deltaproteobacteria bacterium]